MGEQDKRGGRPPRGAHRGRPAPLPVDERLSRFLAYVLRHHPEDAGLVLDERGSADLDPLVDAVRDRRLAGAALDVVAGEMEAAGPGASPAVRFAATDDRILVTPHIGGATLESMENTEIFMAEKLARWVRGEPVRVDAGPSAAPSTSPQPPAP